ncbi:restriction endonuclease [Streptomyces sp. NPDC059010]|uniref:restriction endonuclease n=1 Tax=Streptomyces sp. NPDC059010 TaxID=3346695 RepID=UPI00367611C0
MAHNDAYHWPPELLDLLIELVPRLNRSKEGVLGFLRGAGVSEDLLAPHRHQLAADKSAVSKYKIVRAVLSRINEQGDAGLGVRREILKRTIEFEDFSTLWPDDRLPAQGLQASVRRLVNVKDSFTRMSQAHDEERAARIKARTSELERLARRKARFQALRDRLNDLFNEDNPKKRGTALEGVLNDLFATEGILIRESFTLRSEEGHPVEQIDGALEVDGSAYLVEIKWWGEPVEINAMSRHLVRVYGRSEVRALFISASGFTGPAIEESERALNQRVIVLAELRELVLLLERQGDVVAWLREKVRFAQLERRPLAVLGSDF